MTLPKGFTAKTKSTSHEKRHKRMITAGKIIVAVGCLLLIPAILNRPINLVVLVPAIITGITLWTIGWIRTTGYPVTDARMTIYHILNWGGKIIMAVGIGMSVVIIIGIATLNPSLFTFVDYWTPMIIIGIGFLIRFIGVWFHTSSTDSKQKNN